MSTPFNLTTTNLLHDLLTTRRRLQAMKAMQSHIMVIERFAVVTSGSLPLTFERSRKPEGGTLFTKPRVCRIFDAPLFAGESAVALAKQVTNGKGEKAAAVHIIDLIEIQMRENEDLIKAIEGLQVKE